MTELVVEQVIEAPPSTVYRYLTESEKWKKWQGVDADVDSRIGGLFSILMANGMSARGEFLELVPDRLVTFTWGWVDRPGIPPGSSVVEIELRSRGEGTLLVLTHRSLPPDEVEQHRMGWVHYTTRLSLVSVGEDLGPDPGLG